MPRQPGSPKRKTVPTEVTHTNIQPTIDLSITKIGTPNPASLAGNVTWTMVVTNKGPSAATGVTVADPAPAGTSFVSVATTQGTCTGGAVVSCAIGSMPAGSNVTVTLVSSANPSNAGQSVTFTANVSGALGRGGYEGIQDDSAGNVWIVEDVSGAAKSGTKAKRPNSFIYRYVPSRPGDLANGKLQVLQVWNGGHPVTFDSQASLNNSDQVDLRTYGKTFETKWVTIHDTASDGNAPFDSNSLAKAADATPFKRPENGQFRPGSGFTQFFFDETGDTNADSPENGTAGGWTSIFKLVQQDPSANTGRLSLFYEGNESVAGLDNVTFISRNLVTFVEDAGDTLHSQRKALDSGFIFDVTKDYSHGAQPVRWLGEGRDPSATLDSAGVPGGNEGDNEITGVHVSDGDPSIDGILGAKIPQVFDNPKWRWFWTQQHGDNITWEVIPASGN